MLLYFQCEIGALSNSDEFKSTEAEIYPFSLQISISQAELEKALLSGGYVKPFDDTSVVTSRRIGDPVPIRCGRGVKRRTVYCGDPNDPQPANECDATIKPPDLAPCHIPCPTTTTSSTTTTTTEKPTTKKPSSGGPNYGYIPSSSVDEGYDENFPYRENNKVNKYL